MRKPYVRRIQEVVLDQRKAIEQIKALIRKAPVRNPVFNQTPEGTVVTIQTSGPAFIYWYINKTGWAPSLTKLFNQVLVPLGMKVEFMQNNLWVDRNHGIINPKFSQAVTQLDQLFRRKSNTWFPVQFRNDFFKGIKTVRIEPVGAPQKGQLKFNNRDPIPMLSSKVYNISFLFGESK